MPGEPGPGTVPLRPPFGLPIRRDGCSGLLRRCAGALGTGLPAGRRGYVQQPRQRHPDERPHRTPGDHPVRGESRVHPGPGGLDGRNPWLRPISPRSGTHGGIGGIPRDIESLCPSVGSRRPVERMGNDVPGADAFSRGPQPVPSDDVPPHGRDNPDSGFQ